MMQSYDDNNICICVRNIYNNMVILCLLGFSFVAFLHFLQFICLFIPFETCMYEYVMLLSCFVLLTHAEK